MLGGAFLTTLARMWVGAGHLSLAELLVKGLGLSGVANEIGDVNGEACPLVPNLVLAF